jgi:integrase
VTRTRQRRNQGWITLERRTTPHRWVAHWYFDQPYRDKQGRQRFRQGTHVLGFKTKDDLPTKGSAQARWDAIREEVMGGAARTTVAPKGPLTFQRFLNEEFIPIRRGGWNKATQGKLSYFFNLMSEDFGPVLLTEIDKKRLQRFLNNLSARLCFDTVNGCYIYLRAVFAEAQEQGLISENPARKLSMPHARERDTYTVSLQDVQRIEKALSGRDQVIFKLFSRCGPRAGEVFGFKWKDLHPDQSIRIERTYSRGELKPPKTKKSRKPIYLPTSLYEDLLALKAIAEDPSPEAWVFPSSRRRRPGADDSERGPLMPLDYHNWVNRKLKPVADKLGIRVNCQIMRRTFATLANEAGGDLKDIQAQMRHSRSATTADIYVQPIARSVRESIEALDRILGEPQDIPEKKRQGD